MSYCYWSVVRSAAAMAGSTIDSADTDIPEAALIRFPGLSKGLPPPLWSLKSVCEFPSAVVVLEGELVGLLPRVVVGAAKLLLE